MIMYNHPFRHTSSINVYFYNTIFSNGYYILMADKLMTLLVGLLIALGGWSFSRTFELSTIQAVHEDKVDKLERQVFKTWRSNG